MIQGLVRWFEENQRTLPWRRTYDPYHVWVSEIMLQQTQVETVLPYFERFISEFPTVAALAAADPQAVLTRWAGLGYYSRARNLREAARRIVQNHGGVIPCDYESLIQLPGVGQYTAGAILSIAFNRRYPIVDGNVRRVLSRVHGWPDATPGALWKAASELVASQDGEPREINQAVMELGATVCSFKAPRCLLCPIQDACVAFRAGLQDSIPAVKKRPQTVHVHLFAVVCAVGDQRLMRAVDGFWEFPTFAELPSGDFKEIGPCRHTITHHRLDITVCEGVLPAGNGLEWKEPETVPLSSLTRKILRVHSRNWRNSLIRDSLNAPA